MQVQHVTHVYNFTSDGFGIIRLDGSWDVLAGNRWFYTSYSQPTSLHIFWGTAVINSNQSEFIPAL